MSDSTATTAKLALMLAGVSQADIAGQCQVYPSAVSAVVNGRGRSKQIERRIEIATGVPRERLWPQWYGPAAQKRRKRLSAPEMLARLNALCPAPDSQEAA